MSRPSHSPRTDRPTHSWSWALLEKPPIVQLLKNFPAFYETRKFIIVFTRALHLSLSWARTIQFISSHPISLRSVLVLLPNYVLAFSVVFFLLAFPPISYMHSYLTHSCYMLCPSYPPLLDQCNYTLRRVQVMRLLIMQFSPTSCHLISLRSKYPQHPVLKPQSMLLP
jgi:hypothetical protein